MPIYHSFNLTLDLADYIQQGGERCARWMQRPDMRAEIEAAHADLCAAVEPGACWEQFPISGLHDRQVELADGTRIGAGPLVEFVEGAAGLIMLVCTAGPQIDARLEAYHASGDPMRAVFFDEMANWAVGCVRQEVLQHIIGTAKAGGLQTGVPISPGQSGWPITDQRHIFRLLDPARIGVTLKPSLLMAPIKSTSTVMGIGPDPIGPAIAGKVPCDFCDLQDRCLYSRAGQGAAPAGR